MSIPRKKLAEVRRQVHAARTETLMRALEGGDSEAISEATSVRPLREQRAQARLAARQMKSELRLGRQSREVREAWTPPKAASRQFNLTDGALVRFSKELWCQPLGTTQWVRIAAGSTAIAMGRLEGESLHDRPARPLWELMVPGVGVVHVDPRHVRDASDED